MPKSKIDPFKFIVWGARGSIPSPGPDTIKYGGNTSCLEVRCGKEIIIFDAGTGIRNLGTKLLKEMPFHATILLSHAHWDHIQGFPFFLPAYMPGNTFDFYGEEQLEVEEVLKRQMISPTFPITLDEMESEFSFYDLKVRGEIKIGEAQIVYDRLNHPGNVTTFRVNYKGKSMVYATDTEHFSCLDPTLLKLAHKTDILIYDAQYTDDEYSGKDGMPRTAWGHSTWNKAVEMAQAAKVKTLILWHHDPYHEDTKIDSIEKQAQKEFKESYAAYEGMEIDLI